MVLSEKNKSKLLGVALIIFLSILIFTVRYPIISYSPDEGTQEMYNFIKNSTVKESILLTPIYKDSFRLRLERAIVVNFKIFPFNELAMIEWYERINDTSNGNVFNIRKGYNSLSEEDVVNLKDKYNFSYAIFEVPNKLNFKIIFENEKFIVYDLVERFQ